jgi:hypothetical protein
VITRRSALAALSGLAAGAAAWVAWLRFRGPSFSEPAGLAQVGAAFAFESRSRWHELGKRYLAEYPDDRDVDRWVAEMLGRTGGCCRDREELVLVTAERVRADFAAGQTVSIQGWILARTEARLAALAALSSHS